MNQEWIEMAILAFIAGFVLFRLYTTLGRRPERPPEPRPQPAQGALPQEERSPIVTAPVAASGPAGEGLSAIVRADPSFDMDHFVTGARGAYEIIIGAYAKGDREALKGLLTERVYESYVAAIAAREERNELGPELVRLKHAEIADAKLVGDVAQVGVRFEAELADGAVGVRDAREKWTFERNTRSNDPNWRLARVAQA